MRPTQLPPPALRALRDDDVPDFLEGNAVAALAFVRGGDPVCERLLEKLAFVAQRLDGTVAAAAVDVGREGVVAEAMGVKAVPLVVVFVGGELVDRLMGSPPEAVIEETIRLRVTPPSDHR